jgi:hypothetical protein
MESVNDWSVNYLEIWHNLFTNALFLLRHTFGMEKTTYLVMISLEQGKDAYENCRVVNINK